MKRLRWFIAAASLLPVVRSAELPQPNILLILVDDLGYGEISANGQTRYATPNIDRLGREGLVFTDAYAGSATCAPSRNCLMTGQHTGHTTIRGNFAGGGGSGGRVGLGPADRTIAERLRDAGYTTALIGKWGLGEDGTDAAPWRRGWDFFYGFVNQAHAHNHFPEFLYRDAEKEPLVDNYGNARKRYTQDLFTQETLDFLGRQQHSTRPFFLDLAYTLPHADVIAPKDALVAAAKQFPGLTRPGVLPSALTFAAMVLRLDRDVGRVMARLRELGLEKNTLVIFTSDNGPHRDGGKDPAWFRSAGPFRGIKLDLYEGGIREPFIARWPGRIAPGTQTGHATAFWDFPATALELAGVTRPADLPAEGISFVPALFGRAAAQKEHPYLYWELMVNGQARQAVREGEWKIVRYGLRSAPELYDLRADPGEQTNVAAQHPALVAHLRDLLATARTPSPVFPLESVP